MNRKNSFFATTSFCSKILAVMILLFTGFAIESCSTHIQDLTGVKPNTNTDNPAGKNGIMKQGLVINSILTNSLHGNTTATRFVHSTTPPADVASASILSLSSSKVPVYAWLEGTTIYFYASGYTDSGKKIPLNSDSKYIFMNCTSLEEIDTAYFDTSDVVELSGLFWGCSALTSIDVSGFITSKTRYMDYMFYNCSSLTTINVSNFDTSAVTLMGGMFSQCSSLTVLDLSNFNTSGVNYMAMMFSECSNLNTIYVSEKFDTRLETNAFQMFYDCNNLTGGKGTVFDPLYDDHTYARIDNAPSLPGYFTQR